MAARISQEEREKQIKELCEGTIYSFVGWDRDYVGAKSRFICKCEKHGLENKILFNFIINSTRCSKCKTEKLKIINTIPESEVIDDIQKRCKGTLYSFQGWVSEFQGQSSKFKCLCEKHGVWELTPNKFKQGKRCPQCHYEKLRLLKRKSELEWLDEIKQKCSTKNYEFVGFIGEYKNNSTKFVCRCNKHGEFKVSIMKFVSKGTGCPKCAKYGYQPGKKATLYGLRSDCGQYVKIGISNDLKRRLCELKRKTPFPFEKIELFTHEDGAKAQEWEKLFHQTFESANLTGFDGCTEWLKWNPEIPLWFKFIT